MMNRIEKTKADPAKAMGFAIAVVMLQLKNRDYPRAVVAREVCRLIGELM